MSGNRSWTQRIAEMILPLICQVVVATILLGALAHAENRKAVANPTPEYPEIARRMNINGVVKVELVIGADGTIKSAKVLGGHPVLADAVQKALQKWKYAPGPSETTMQLEFRF
jgi:TonB family protein